MLFTKLPPPALARGLLTAVLTLCLCLPAVAEEDTAPPTWGAGERQEKSLSTGTGFFDDANVTLGLHYFQRDRRRYSPAENKYKTNLHHASLMASGEFVSGFIGDFIGFDFGVFASTDLQNSGAPDHEMGFVPWSNPWRPDWAAKNTDSGASIYKAHLKIKADKVWAKAGYFQPAGPGILGVNWSMLPGTYQGVELGGGSGPWEFAGAIVNAYKAPWYRHTFSFRKNDGDTRIHYMWSLGARYRTENGLTLEAAYGEAENFMRNAHIKTGYQTGVGDGSLDLGYHLYIMRDMERNDSPNASFDGTAFQHYGYAAYNEGRWTFKLEGTYTLAPQSAKHHSGYFAYRLTRPNGSSKGAYDAWWDARSDWNHDQEAAVFFGVTRDLDDIFGVKGLYAGVSCAYGWNGRAYGYSEHLEEYAFNFDLGYTVPDGWLKGAIFKFHFTEYRNRTHLDSWEGFQNAFQDERDFKFLASIPFSL